MNTNYEKTKLYLPFKTQNIAISYRFLLVNVSAYLTVNRQLLTCVHGLTTRRWSHITVPTAEGRHRVPWDDSRRDELPKLKLISKYYNRKSHILLI